MKLTVLLWLLTLLQGATPASLRVPPTPSLPPGYRVLDGGSWRWATPGGRPEPPPGFGDFIERHLSELRTVLEAQDRDPPLIVRASNRTDFHRAVAHFGGGPPGDFVTAIAFPTLGVMVLDGERLGFLPPGSSPETIVHELVHLVLGDGGARVPRWYHEGLAQYLSGRRLATAPRQRLAWMARRAELLPLDQLSVFLPRSHDVTDVLYGHSLCFVELLDAEHGRPVHARILAGLRRGETFEAAYQTASGEPLAVAEARWTAHLAGEARWWGPVVSLLGLFQVLAVAVVLGFLMEAWRRRVRLRRMAREEAEDEPTNGTRSATPGTPDEGAAP